MPEDRWGIPYFYPTASDAGVTGSGDGFFWQQNNDIHKDDDYEGSGMVRIGKEHDDIDVINSTTGEWEFPFDSGASYFCMEVRQGHKSGGEEHGCEGSCYIFNVTINDTPPNFYYQKQMYHGGSKFRDPITGLFNDSRVTEKVVGSGWKGFAAVIYNKQDGRSAGKDSAILEIWWNEDPVANIGNWFMVKRTEDKGGWGTDGDSCDGDDDQVITWSNVQFRYKSGTPDFSLHPLKPEFDDGPVIHSIGGADMSFEDSENRGYGYRADMPANVEMKCLFKFDSNNGICRLKNLSLREIDPNKSFDENTGGGNPEEPSGNTTNIQGSFKTQWDVNQLRVSPCAGSGGGGAGGSTQFYIIPADIDQNIGTATSHITRVSQQQIDNTSGMNGQIIKQLDVPLKKSGSPAATPLVYAKIWSSGGTVIYTSPTTFDPSTFTTSYVTKQFDFSTNTHVFVTGDRVGIEYEGNSDSNFIRCGYSTTLAGAGKSDYSHFINSNGVPPTASYRSFNGVSDFISYGNVHSMSGDMTVSAWFRTSKDYTVALVDGMIVNKGGTGGETAGTNSNYNIRVFKESNMIRAGFEETNGTDHEPSSSPIVVNDGQWHHALFTNDGTTVILYLDGEDVKHHTFGPGPVPETNSQPLIIGRNSHDATRYFQGDIAMVRIWNRDLTPTEAIGVYTDIIPSSGLVFEEKFGGWVKVQSRDFACTMWE